MTTSRKHTFIRGEHNATAMKNHGQEDFTNRHPHVGFRTNPDVKEMLLNLQKENGGTLSDTVESVVINGLNNMHPRSPNKNDVENDVDVMERFDGYIQGIKDKAHNVGFSEGYNKCAVELQDKINGKLNGLKTAKDDEDDAFACKDCGADITENDNTCPKCGVELDWDNATNDDSEDDGGILSEILDFISDIFNSILGNAPTPDADEGEDDHITFTGGNVTPTKTSKDDEDDDEGDEYNCQDCGAVLTHGQAKCPSCGNELNWEGIP